MSPDRILRQASLADCRLPDRLSWQYRLDLQLQDFLESTPTEADPNLQNFSVQSARSAFVQEIQIGMTSKALVYRDIKEGYQCEPYIQSSRNRHLRSIIARFRTGSHWLHVETGSHADTNRSDRICPMCLHRIINPGLPAKQFDSFDSDEGSPGPIEDEHHMIFECSGYAEA